MCLTGCASAQKLSVVSATKQSWSGGVAGRHGTNYTIILKWGTGKEIPDSLYVEGKCIPLVINARNGNTKMDSAKHTYTIYTGVAYNDLNRFHPMPGDKDKQNKADSVPRQTRQYAGDALLIYHYKGKKRLLIIKEMKSLSPLNYP